MTNFHIDFSNPWLLLLLIPAILFALLPYFRLSKKFRRNRNRVISVVLHTLIMVLAVTLLAGIGFSYQVPNTENEILLLVDVSDSSEASRKEKDDFVQAAIDAKSPTMKMGIVTFGYDQVYAAQLSYESENLYEQYLNAPLPDTSATDFEAALRYARSLLTNPESAKIIVISDGDETDGYALDYVKTIAAEGIKVDTAFFPNENTDNEVRIVDVTFPESGVAVNSEFEMTLTVQSNVESLGGEEDYEVAFTMSDNDAESEEQIVKLTGGLQTITLRHTFELAGLHRMSFRITDTSGAGDTLTQNNLYHAYYYLEVYDDILIIERTKGESDELYNILDEADYNTTVVTVSDTEKMPSTVDELREYDEVILVNIANADMPSGFDVILNSYVYDYGGNLFTVGGRRTENGEQVANAYNRDDLRNTLYQEMLPVEAVDYTPPIAVVFIIDRSGSMSGQKLELAKQGAIESLHALNDRDWVGVMTLETNYTEELALTPVPQIADVEAAISAIQPGGGTNYAPAIERAGRALMMCSSVQQRHIVIISDAEPNDQLWTDPANQKGGYGEQIKKNYENGITCSIVSVSNSGYLDDMKTAAELGGGNFYYETDMAQLADTLMKDLQAANVNEFEDSEPITPRIGDVTSVVSGISQQNMPSLGGYFGTRLKSNALQPLVSPYDGVPIYAQWDYGKGKVGSFMSELSTEWASSFLNDETGTGRRIIQNIITALYPTENIRPQEVSATLTEQNYTTKVNIFNVNEGETVELKITGPTLEDGSTAQVLISQPTAEDYYSTASFVVRTPGYYTILVEKKDAEGNVIGSTTVYKSFSYSAEYDYFADEDENGQYLTDLAQNGKGASIEEAVQVFDSLVRVFDRAYDPRVVIAILIIVLFLLDVAVRKFKFKWPHELIREHKAKKAQMKHNRENRTSWS